MVRKLKDIGRYNYISSIKKFQKNKAHRPLASSDIGISDIDQT